MRESCAQLPESIGDLLSQSQTLDDCWESLQSLSEAGMIKDWSISLGTSQGTGSLPATLSVRLPTKLLTLDVSIVTVPI